MKISNMIGIMKLAQLSNDTVHMVGLHGIGKSKIVEQFAQENNIHLEILMLSQNEVADLIGIPTEKDGVTYWSKPVWLDRAEKASLQGKHCLLFLDEIARAPLEVRQAALQLVLDRRIHEHHLPEFNGLKALVVAADNPSDTYQTDELDPALLDRFMTYSVETDIDGWLKWARANNIISVVTDFVAEYPDKLHFIPEDAGSNMDKGATPRAWAKLSDIIRNIDIIDEALIFDVFNSKLGKTVGSGFYHYYNNYTKIIKVADIVDIIVDSGIDISEKEGQKEAGKLLSKTTKEIEQISAAELAHKIKEEIKAGQIEFHVMTAYMASLNVEIATSIYKAWKSDEGSEDEKFFYDWALSMGKARWLFAELIAMQATK